MSLFGVPVGGPLIGQPYKNVYEDVVSIQTTGKPPPNRHSGYDPLLDPLEALTWGVQNVPGVEEVATIVYNTEQAVEEVVDAVVKIGGDILEGADKILKGVGLAISHPWLILAAILLVGGGLLYVYGSAGATTINLQKV